MRCVCGLCPAWARAFSSFAAALERRCKADGLRVREREWLAERRTDVACLGLAERSTNLCFHAWPRACRFSCAMGRSPAFGRALHSN